MAIVVVLQGKHKGLRLRRIEAWAEVDGAWRVMVFITNNLAWSPRSVCDALPPPLGHRGVLHAALRGDTRGAVGATRPRGATEILWDSIGPLQRGKTTAT
jgi:hypothetical protein